MVSVSMEWTVLTVAVTQASLESYARLTLMIVLELTVMEIENAWMERIPSAVNAVLATLDHSVIFKVGENCQVVYISKKNAVTRK